VDDGKNNFEICCCVFTKLILYEVADDFIGHVSWFNNFIGRFSRSTRPCPWKSADFIDHLISPLVQHTIQYNKYGGTHIGKKCSEAWIGLLWKNLMRRSDSWIHSDDLIAATSNHQHSAQTLRQHFQEFHVFTQPVKEPNQLQFFCAIFLF